MKDPISGLIRDVRMGYVQRLPRRGNVVIQGLEARINMLSRNWTMKRDGLIHRVWCFVSAEKPDNKLWLIACDATNVSGSTPSTKEGRTPTCLMCIEVAS